MTRFGPPLPSLKPNGKKGPSSDFQKPHGKHTSAAAAGIKPRRMSLGSSFVSSSDFDFDEEFKKGPKGGTASNTRRMSLTPMHETGRFNIDNDKGSKGRSLRRMSLQGACKRGSDGKRRDTGVAAKDSSKPVSKQAASTKCSTASALCIEEEAAKHASSFAESVKHVLDDFDENKTGAGGSVKDEKIVWRDGLLQQWDSLLDASCGFKSISVAYDEHRRKSDEAITGSVNLTKADDDLLLPKIDTTILECGEKTAALAAPDVLESQSFSENLNVMEAITAAERPQIVCSCRQDDTLVIDQEQSSSRRTESTCCKGLKDIYMVECVARIPDEQLQYSGSEIAENLKEFEADCDYDQPLKLPASDKPGGIELTPHNAAKTVDADSKCPHRAYAAPMKFLYTAAATAGILVAGAALLGCTYHRQVRSPL